MKRLFVIAGIMLIMGAGCGAKRQGVVAPTKEQVMAQYQQASVEQGKEVSYLPEDRGGRVVLTIPSDWTGGASTWRPSEDSKDFIRVQYFVRGTAETEWTKQQSEDVHQVLQATKNENRYLLIVHHLGLKATLAKMFVQDPERAAGYAFAECRIMDEQKDDTSLWNACRTALESIH